MATVSGGQGNTAGGATATVPGGIANTAGGSYSFAAGRRAKANNTGSFAWADSTNADFNVSNNNRFGVRASGGVYLYTNGTLNAGSYLATGSGTWASVSDRDRKENVKEVDAAAVLEKLAAIPVTTWNYESEDASVRHMGPMAQDLRAAFGLGDSDKSIATIDADGISLAAIQGLYELARKRENRIRQLEEEKALQETEISSLRQSLAELQRRPAALESGARK